MNCVFADPNILKRIVAALSKDLGLVNFYFNENALKINAMNDSHTDMREFVLDKSFFVSYTCEKPLVIGVNITILNTFIKTAGMKDTITWDCNPEPTIMSILVQDASENKTSTTFTLKLIDFEEDALSLPEDIAWDCHFRIGTALLRQWIAKSKLIDGNVGFKIEKGKEITMEVKSETMGTIQIKQPIPSVMAQMIQSTPEFTLQEKIISAKEADCLDMLIQCSPGVDIQFETSMPVCCTSYLDKDMKSYVRLWIAPLMEEEDE